MFNDYVILHTPPAIATPQPDKNVCSAEKMTQTSDGNIWQVNLPQPSLNGHNLTSAYADCSDLGLNEAMTCQELLAFSVAFSAALPTSQTTLESFYSTLAKPDVVAAVATEKESILANHNYYEEFGCCMDLYQNASLNDVPAHQKRPRNKFLAIIVWVYRLIDRLCSFCRRYVRLLVEHKYFHQGILLAILINTLSMGIEYHNQPEELTAIVETSNIVFSGIFAVEMLLKVVAYGPFKYIANGFNVFDGVIVILR